MKFINKKILFAVTALFIVILIPFIQSCSSNNEFDDTEKVQNNVELTASEKNEIINSTEFKDFVDANIEIAALVKSIKEAQKTSSKAKAAVDGTTKNGNTYTSYPFEYDYDNIKILIRKVNAFNEKFPLIKNVSSKEKRNLMSEAVSKSKEFQKKMFTSGLIKSKLTTNTRQKISQNESYGGGNIYFSDWYNAFNYINVSVSSSSTPVECGGFILEDGTAVIFDNPNATISSSDYPSSYTQPSPNDPQTILSFYNGKRIVATFHNHYKGSAFSTSDNSSNSYVNDADTQRDKFPNCTLIILYQGQANYYNFEDGYYTYYNAN